MIQNYDVPLQDISAAIDHIETVNKIEGDPNETEVDLQTKMDQITIAFDKMKKKNEELEAKVEEMKNKMTEMQNDVQMKSSKKASFLKYFSKKK